MLEMRPGCERCDGDLPGDSEDAFICSFECTFCRECATNVLQQTCPNCAGRLLQRPRRSHALMEKFPASTQRVYNPG